MTQVLTHSLQDVGHSVLGSRQDVSSPRSSESGVKCASGPARTHTHLTDADAVIATGPRVTRRETYLCKGAVNTARLLHLTRKEVYDIAKDHNANVLLNEEWSCDIKNPWYRSKDEYKAIIQYSANIARSHREDAQKPVAIENARGIEGVMIVLERRG
ncbi:hypothetical protein BDQ12DRAFT_711145 [Crucibulum laeve]|uniref:Uncharacterized protein n=1 Tax=Crucibulum laeve TaxID=68775 RepID=A0A5C3M7U2_9AGAR|nr:hypothetical protein BDQ12DRAFT_711145 [Crucibulum laeve]